MGKSKRRYLERKGVQKQVDLEKKLIDESFLEKTPEEVEVISDIEELEE
ncbi:MAG: hypothetical protein ACXQT3_00295 [Methermicoccaceae archaeon]